MISDDQSFAQDSFEFRADKKKPKNVYGAQQRCHEFENGSKKDHNCHLSQCFALVELRKERRRGFPLIRAQFVRKTIKTEGFFSGSLERRIMKK
jgi:hypothetical protein